MKKSNLISTAIFSIFISSFFVMNVFSSDKDFSDEENRTLAKLPKFTLESLFSGELSQNIDAYITDQFVFRDKFIGIKSSFEQLLGKKENNGVYISNENTLIDKFLQPDYTKIDKSINAINKFIENVEIPVNFTIIPTQNDIYSFKLPQNAPIISQKDMIDYAYDKISGSIDVYTSLMEHNDEYLFYNTDHHWTSLGAYYAYAEIIESLGKTPLSLDDFEKTILTTEFNGTIYSKAGVKSVKPDEIFTYIPNKDIIIEDATGERDAMLYDLSKLENKDKYEVFIGGNFPIVCVPGSGEGDLLLVKDSYSNTLVPFLSEHFANIHMVDLRFMKMPMSGYITDNGIDQVLICYAASNFSTDSNIIFLK